MTMSRLAEFRELEAQLAAMRAELDVLKNDPSLLKKIAFEEKLRALLSEYSYSLPDLVSVPGPRATSPNDDPTTHECQHLGVNERPVFSWDLPNETFS
jgi:hypothetical protein